MCAAQAQGRQVRAWAVVRETPPPSPLLSQRRDNEEIGEERARRAVKFLGPYYAEQHIQLSLWKRIRRQRNKPSLHLHSSGERYKVNSLVKKV